MSLECLSTDFFTENAPEYSKNDRVHDPAIPRRVTGPLMEFGISQSASTCE